jgi:hypothetical protein
MLERARELLAIYKQAKKLATEKVYNVEDVAKKRRKRIKQEAG